MSSLNIEELKESSEEKGRIRHLRGSWKQVVTIISIAFCLFHLYTGGFYTLPALQQRPIHLVFVLALIFLLYPLSERTAKAKWLFWVDLVLASLVAVSGLYICFEYKELTFRVGLPNTADLIFGFIILILLLEGTRRIMGMVMPIIALVFLGYAILGDYIPGLWGHGGYTLPRILNHMYLTTEGIWGTTLGVSATFVALFIIFAAFLEKSGAGEFFLNFANALIGHVRGGPAKVAVLASAFFGTFSGSATANVAGTGSITIPMMKRIGYAPEFAATVEALASSGGQLMPPIMGAAAFLMTETLGISYVAVMKAAILPAILYFVSCYFAVDFRAGKEGLKGLSREEIPKLKKIVIEERGYLYIIPILVLLFLLMVLRASPQKSAVYSLFVLIVCSLLTKDRITLSRIIAAFEAGAKGSLLVAAVCAVAGIVIGVVNLTGLGLKLSALLVELSGGHLPVLLLLAMVASIILGMGLPTTACYVVLAVLAAPALVKLNVVPIGAHLFVFYFGILAGLTPPVAATAYVAAGIAGTPPPKNCAHEYLVWARCFLASLHFRL